MSSYVECSEFEVFLGYFLDYLENGTPAAKDDLLDLIGRKGFYDLEKTPDQNIISLGHELGLSKILDKRYVTVDLE